MDDEAERERLARVLSDHDIGAVIGRGQFGVVWSATHVHLSRPVAVKRLVDEVSVDTEHSARFRREARTLARLDHKHVVAVHDYREADGMRLLLMEMLQGGTLADRRSRMPLQTAVAATLAAAAGLHHAHTAGVLHRDVKPENLMFDDRGVLKVTDFGLARGDARDSRVDLSRAGAFLGTPAYIAPEQAAVALGQGWPTIGPTADEYSLAAVLYEILTGSFTHDATGGGVALCHRRMTAPARPTADAAGDAPPLVAAVLDRALALDPRARYPSTEAFGVALATAATRTFGNGWLARSEVAVREPGPILDAASSPQTGTPPPLPPPAPPPLPPSLSPDSAAAPATPPRRSGATARRRAVAASAILAVALIAAAALILPAGRGSGKGDRRTSTATTLTPPSGRGVQVAARWSTPTGGNVFSSPAITPELVISGSDDGVLRGLGRDDGRVRWTAPTGGRIASSPTVDGDLVVVGSADGSVHAVATATGAARWSTPLGYEIVSTPAVRSGTVVVGADRLHALDESSGARRWSLATDADIVSSPLIAASPGTGEDTVVVASTAGTVYAASLADGTPRWSRRLGSPVESSPREAGGIVYVGTTGGALHALRIADGTDVWTVDVGSALKSSPLATAGQVVVGTDDGHLLAFDASDGHRRWAWTGTRPVDSSPALGDGWVVVGSNDRDVHVIDWTAGRELGRFSTGGPVLSSPRVDGDAVYVGSHDDRIYALRVTPS